VAQHLMEGDQKLRMAARWLERNLPSRRAIRIQKERQLVLDQ
jgi:hypothetical protein